MKLKCTDSRAAFNLYIDDKKIEDFTLQEQKDILKSLIGKYGDNSTIQIMIVKFIKLNVYPKFIGYCNDCDDDVYEYTLEI